MDTTETPQPRTTASDKATGSHSPERTVGEIDLRPTVEIAVPVFDEESSIQRCITELHAYVSSSFPHTTVVAIVDNGSDDRTLARARELAANNHWVRICHLDKKGRGGALRHAWMSSRAQVVCYMDVDLSTSLEALNDLVDPLVAGEADISIGTRLHPDSTTRRSRKREIVSRSYSFTLRRALALSASDAQCGFKAMRLEAARSVMPLVQDDGWFFDTELLFVSQKLGLRLNEVPVEWTEDPNSKVKIISTAVADLKGIRRLPRHPDSALSGSVGVWE